MVVVLLKINIFLVDFRSLSSSFFEGNVWKFSESVFYVDLRFTTALSHMIVSFLKIFVTLRNLFFLLSSETSKIIDRFYRSENL